MGNKLKAVFDSKKEDPRFVELKKSVQEAKDIKRFDKARELVEKNEHLRHTFKYAAITRLYYD